MLQIEIYYTYMTTIHKNLLVRAKFGPCGSHVFRRAKRPEIARSHVFKQTTGSIRFVRNNMYETMLKLVFPFIIIPLRDEKHSTSNAKSVQCTSKGHTQGCANSERLNV